MKQVINNWLAQATQHFKRARDVSPDDQINATSAGFGHPMVKKKSGVLVSALGMIAAVALVLAVATFDSMGTSWTQNITTVVVATLAIVAVAITIAAVLAKSNVQIMPEHAPQTWNLHEQSIDAINRHRTLTRSRTSIFHRMSDQLRHFRQRIQKALGFVGTSNSLLAGTIS